MIALLLAACVAPVDLRGPLAGDGCDPVDPTLCVLPFPSDAFLATDDATNTGMRVAFGPEALPRDLDDVQYDPASWNRRDGWSVNSQLLVDAGDVDEVGLLSHTDLGAYLDDDVTTVIVNAETGERVPHWAERDINDRPHEQLLILRPATPLEWNTDYAVGIRGLSERDGSPIPVSDGFRSLRSGQPSDDPDVERQRDRFETVVFPTLEEAGFARSELQRAWSFHTASRQGTLGDMLHIREDLFDQLPPGGPEYVVDRVQTPGCEGSRKIGRTLEGHFTVPLYNTQEEAPSVLNRDEDGRPYADGTTEVPFVVRIPCSLITSPGTGRAPLVQMGHGLLGYYQEVRDDYLNDMAHAHRWILFSVPWRGMSWYERPEILYMVADDASRFAEVPERSMQGMAGALAAMDLMTGSILDEDIFHDGGHHYPDPSQRYYYGNSQGAILGAALVGMSEDIDRAVLGVGGAPFSLLLDRSVDFTPFLLILEQQLTDRREVTLYVDGLIQQLWDPAEAAGWIRDLEDKDVLLQVAIGDAEVTPLGAHFMARGANIPLLAPPAREVWGLEQREAPFAGSALVEWRYTDVPDAPTGPEPPELETSPHECPRRQPDAQLQAGLFLSTGRVEVTCGGEPCEAVQTEHCLGL